MEHKHASAILKELWSVYGCSIELEYSSIKTREQVLDEFFFVLLGGFGISYELNKSALQILKQRGLFNEKYYRDKNNLFLIEEKIREQFSLQQFSPSTINGQLRKYRYIETKPITISAAGSWLWEKCEWKLYDSMQEMNTTELRVWLCSCPGIGLKSASWFLRNIGISDDYAVFDVHVIRFLDYLGFDIPTPLTEKMYLKLEESLRKVCSNVGVSLGKIDYLLWILSRNGFLDYINRGERV
jgi:Thermostable 8-oxoguanine DNA glycosylase